MKQMELQFEANETPIKELLIEQTPALQTKKPTELITRKPIENSPFWIIKDNEKFFTVMGKNKLTPDFKSEEELMKYMDENTWMIIFHMTAIICEELINSKNQNQ